jgi:hypothetical protein
MDKEQMYQDLGDAQELASKIIDNVQNLMGDKPGITDDEAVQIRAALCIAYSTFCTMTGTSLHESLEMVMTVYKNTVIVGGKDE